MCLSPKFVINPEMNLHRRDVQHVHFLLNNYDVTIDDYYFYTPKPSTQVTLSTYKEYYVITSLGEVIFMYMPVPCGNCVECKASKASHIKSRMLLEQVGHDTTPYFVTLTYDDLHLPSDGVCQRDVTLFLKRLHINLQRSGYSSEFRHVFFSEYGTQYGRPHYHGIIFGLCDLSKLCDILHIIEKSWQNGFCYVKPCNSKAFGYVSKYVCKDTFLSVPHGKNHNFWCASRRGVGGLGSMCFTNPDFFIWSACDTFPKIKIKVLGKVHEIYVPSYIRNKISPTLSKLMPPRVRKEIFNLCSCLNTYRYWQNKELYSDIKPPITPDVIYELRQKFFFYSYLFDEFFDLKKFQYICDHNSDELDFPHSFFYVETDPVQVATRLDVAARYLLSYEIDYEEILSTIHFKDHERRTFQTLIRDYFETQLPEDDRRLALNSSFYRRFAFSVDLQ